MDEKKRPKEVIIGITLLVISILFGIVRFSIGKFIPVGPNIWGIIFVLLSAIISLFFVYKAYRGKRWARNTYLILVIIGIFIHIGNMFYWFTTTPILLVLFILNKITAITGFVYLFKDKSSKWFKTKLKKGLPPQTKKKYIKKVLVFILLLAFLVSLFILISYISPEELVNRIGVENGYIIGFVSSFFGGFSAITAATHISVLATLIAGGLNPVILGFVAGTSIALGDMLMFYFGGKGRELITGRWDKGINHVSEFLKNKKLEKYIPLLSYIYIAFTPLPNDWLILFLAAIEYPSKKTYKIIILGDYTHVLMLTFLISRGMMIFG